MLSVKESYRTLTNRFQHNPEMVHRHINVFHNIIQSHRGDEQWLDTQQMQIDPLLFVTLPDGDDRPRHVPTSSSNQMDLGNSMRDEIANRMWADYQRIRRERSSRRSPS